MYMYTTLALITYFNFSNFVRLSFYAAVVMNYANPTHQLEKTTTNQISAVFC